MCRAPYYGVLLDMLMQLCRPGLSACLHQASSGAVDPAAACMQLLGVGTADVRACARKMCSYTEHSMTAPPAHSKQAALTALVCAAGSGSDVCSLLQELRTAAHRFISSCPPEADSQATGT